MLKKIWNFTKEVFSNFMQDNSFQLGAALAYYTVFSFAPIIIIVIALASIFFGEAAVEGQIYEQLRGLLGERAASETQNLIENAYNTGHSKIAAIISIATLVFGATGVFYVMKSSLNQIWGLKPKPKNGILNLILDRVLSFGMVISIGFILLISLVWESFVTVLYDQLAAYFSETATLLTQIANVTFSLLLTALLFGVIFKALPDAKIRWRDVVVGSVFTAVLFALGKFIIGLYLGSSSVGSTFGAAGSVVILMIWVYYSSQILFLGAEFTYVYAQWYGTDIQPSSNAVQVVKQEVEKENAVAES